MKVCFPVMENEGLESRVFGHFGSAPQFVVVDTVTSEMTAINNSDQIHEHGACNPVAGLGGHEVDAIVVGGIGAGALPQAKRRRAARLSVAGRDRLGEHGALSGRRTAGIHAGSHLRRS